MNNISENKELNALDLAKAYPSSPRKMLAGFVLLARIVDKGRSEIQEMNGEYHYNCPMDQNFFEFSGVVADELREVLASGADDAEVAKWIGEKTAHISDEDRVVWNFGMREKKLGDLDPESQVYLETYIEENVPAGKQVYVLFDIFDLEEGRM